MDFRAAVFDIDVHDERLKPALLLIHRIHQIADCKGFWWAPDVAPPSLLRHELLERVAAV